MNPNDPNNLLKNSIVTNQVGDATGASNINDLYANLQKSLANNVIATSKYADTEQPYAYAQELRSGSMPTPDATTGYLSPLMLLGDMIGKSTGRRDVRNLEAERKGYTETMAQAEQDKAKFDNAMAMDDQKRSVRQAEIADREANQLDEVKEFLYMGEGGEGKSVFLRRDPDGNYVDANGDIVNLDDYAPMPDPTNDKKYITSSASKDILNLGNRTKAIKRSLENYKPHFTQFDYDGTGEGIPTQFLNDMFMGATKNGLLRYANDEKWNQNQRESMVWWSEFLGDFSAEERHRLFGATLTPGEQKSWQEIIGVQQGMSSEDVKALLQGHANRMQRALGNQLSHYKGLVSAPNEVRLIDNYLGQNSDWLRIGEFGAPEIIEFGSGASWADLEPNVVADPVDQATIDSWISTQSKELQDALKDLSADELQMAYAKDNE